MKDFHPRYVPTKHVTSIEILQCIEELSKLKKITSDRIGCNLPNIEWLIGMFFYLSPSDEKNHSQNQSTLSQGLK